MPLLAFILLIIIIPSISILGDVTFPHDEQRILLTVALVSLTILSIRCITAPQAATGYIIFIGLGIVSITLSRVPSDAALEWSLLILSVSTVILLSKHAQQAIFIRHVILPGIGISAVFYSLIALMILFVAWDYEGTVTWPEPIHRFKNIRFLNQYQSWILPLLPALLFAVFPRVRPPFISGLFIAYFALLFALLFYSGGRGTLLGLMIATGFSLFLFGKQSFRWAGIMVGTSLFGIFLSLQLLPSDVVSKNMQRISPLAQVAEEQVLFERYLSGRWEIWVDSVTLIKSSPWLGIGPMGYATLQRKVAHPHNFPLQIALEWGIPAALILFSLLAYAMWHWLRFAYGRVRESTCPSWERTYIISLGASLITASIHSLLSGIAVMPVSQAMLILVVALAYGWYRRYHPIATNLNKNLSLKTWRALTLAAALWLGGFTTYELIHYNDIRTASEIARSAYKPRFWFMERLP